MRGMLCHFIFKFPTWTAEPSVREQCPSRIVTSVPTICPHPLRPTFFLHYQSVLGCKNNIPFSPILHANIKDLHTRLSRQCYHFCHHMATSKTVLLRSSITLLSFLLPCMCCNFSESCPGRFGLAQTLASCSELDTQRRELQPWLITLIRWCVHSGHKPPPPPPFSHLQHLG